LPTFGERRRKSVIDRDFDKEITVLLVIDPYNDFISEGGKIWDRIKGVAGATDCISHMLQLLTAARKTGVRIFHLIGATALICGVAVIASDRTDQLLHQNVVDLLDVNRHLEFDCCWPSAHAR
jgi:hypothetical protein